MAPIGAFLSTLLAGLLGAAAGRPMKVLDIAAGHGLYGIAFARENPQAEVVALDWPNVLTVARARGSALYRERLAGVRIRSLAELRALPVTTRADLQAAGAHGTRALPLHQVCHYGESSGTTSHQLHLAHGGGLRAGCGRDPERAPDVFAPGRSS